ncbi:unnamed protein product [Arctogadus glacialis]
MYCGLDFILLLGFVLAVRAFKNDKCGDNIRITKANYLTSPGYPASYSPSHKCVWVITAPGPHQRILINFNPHFDLEDRECKPALSQLFVYAAGPGRSTSQSHLHLHPYPPAHHLLLGSSPEEQPDLLGRQTFSSVPPDNRHPAGHAFLPSLGRHRGLTGFGVGERRGARA